MMNIRLAVKDDCLNVFQLSNMDYVRAHSFNKEKILWENHVEWFARATADEKIKFFIIEHTEFIGQVRLDITGETALISISILQKFQHKNIAFSALQKIIAENDYTYLAQVQKDNRQSIKLFERLGFVKRKEETDKNYFEYELKNTFVSAH